MKWAAKRAALFAGLAVFTAGFAVHVGGAIEEDTSGVILVGPNLKEAAASEFSAATASGVYFQVTDSQGRVAAIPKAKVLGMVRGLKVSQGTAANSLGKEDFDLIEAKIAELKQFAERAPQSADLLQPRIGALEAFHDAEFSKWQKTVAERVAVERRNTEEQELETKSGLLWLKLKARENDLAKCESIVKEIEPLATQNATLRENLAKWNAEKARALQLRDTGRSLWSQIVKTHPQVFAQVQSLGEVPQFPAEMRQPISDLNAMLADFRKTVEFPQLIEYCKHELAAFFLLAELVTANDDIKRGEVDEAGRILRVALDSAGKSVGELYKPVLTTATRYRELIDDMQTRFIRQLAKAKKSEDEDTTREALAEYEKAYAIRPDAEVAKKIQILKDKLGRR